MSRLITIPFVKHPLVAAILLSSHEIVNFPSNQRHRQTGVRLILLGSQTIEAHADMNQKVSVFSPHRKPLTRLSRNTRMVFEGLPWVKLMN